MIASHALRPRWARTTSAIERASWRTEATLQLGRVKFMPSRGQGNHNAIMAAIEKLKADKDPTIAAAAKAAEEYTKDDVKRGN